MKIVPLTLLILFFNLTLFSQNLNKVDKIIHSYIEPKSIEDLSNRIDYDFKTDIEKIRAIYSWIALNIEYDIFSSNFLKSPHFIIYQNEYDKHRYYKKRKEQLMNKAFKNRKGVCYENALLFQKMCNLLNIKNELVYGYTKSSVNSIGAIPTSKNHVWNTVKLNGEWLLFDVTYGAGYIYKGVWQKQLNLNYFNVKKEKLKLTHYPSQKKWKKHLNQKPLRDFCYDPFYQDAYLKYNIKVIEPKIGKIDVNKSNNRIHIKVSNLKKTDNILYTFSSDNVIRTPILKSNNSYTDVSFKNPKKNTGLHIYINNELAIEYKISLN